MLEYLSKLIDAPLATHDRDMAVAQAVRDACVRSTYAPHGGNGNALDAVQEVQRRNHAIDLAAVIAKVVFQPSAPVAHQRDVVIANAMRKACWDVLEQFNDRHAVKRSEVVTAARLVIDYLDVNKVLAGVKS